MNIPDFTDTEFQLANQILLERYGRLVPLQAVEVELLLDPGAHGADTLPGALLGRAGRRVHRRQSRRPALPLPVLLFRERDIRHRPRVL
jgi:hypothetical protein